MCGCSKTTKASESFVELQGKGRRVWELQRTHWGSKIMGILFPTELDCKRLERGRRKCAKNPRGGGRWEMGDGRDPSRVKPSTATTTTESRAWRSKSFMQLGEKWGHWVQWVSLTPRWLFAFVRCFHFYLHKKGLQRVALGNAHPTQLARACGRKKDFFSKPSSHRILVKSTAFLLKENALAPCMIQLIQPGK